MRPASSLAVIALLGLVLVASASSATASEELPGPPALASRDYELALPRGSKEVALALLPREEEPFATRRYDPILDTTATAEFAHHEARRGRPASAPEPGTIAFACLAVGALVARRRGAG